MGSVHSVPHTFLGALRAACAAGGAVHLLVGSQVWSVEDPTAS